MSLRPDREWVRPRQRRVVDVRLRVLDMDDIYLLTFLNEGHSMADCARALSITPSAVSQRVRKIETALDVPIVVRGARGTKLTNHGTALCQGACEVLPNIEWLFKVMQIAD